jgi:dTMP kinase
LPRRGKTSVPRETRQDNRKTIYMKGKFITFEGSEGCGKSTQSKLLYTYLKKKSLSVIYLREPGGVKVSEKIRQILLDPKNVICAECETLLYMAARAQVVSDIIKPSLSKGKIIICDRFMDSTLAYQGYGLGIDIDFIKIIGKFATTGIKPDLTIFLDLPVKKGLKHREASKDRIEQRNFNYHFRVRKGYLKIAAQEPKRIKVVKVEVDKATTQGKIRELVDKFLR